MTKKIISAVLAVTFILSAIASFGGCAKKLNENEIEAIYNDAVKQTLEQDVYFIKETVNKKDNVEFTYVNVLASIDKKYNIERNDDGSYKDLRIEAFEQLNGDETVRNICGVSGNEGKTFLFTSVIPEKNADPIRTKKEISPSDYYNSDDFTKYRIETFVNELTYLKFSDMDFSADKTEAGTKGKVTTLVFVPAKEYLERYEQETGEKSVFEGCLRVSLEIANGKISQLIVYTEDKIAGSSLSTETESYKLLITYYGPKIYPPDVNSDDWKNA